MRWFVSPPHTSNTSSPRAEACGVAAREVVRLVVAAAGTAAVCDLNGGGGVAFSCVAGSAGGGGTGRSAGGGGGGSGAGSGGGGGGGGGGAGAAARRGACRGNDGSTSSAAPPVLGFAGFFLPRFTHFPGAARCGGAGPSASADGCDGGGSGTVARTALASRCGDEVGSDLVWPWPISLSSAVQLAAAAAAAGEGPATPASPCSTTRARVRVRTKMPPKDRKARSNIEVAIEASRILPARHCEARAAHDDRSAPGKNPPEPTTCHASTGIANTPDAS